MRTYTRAFAPGGTFFFTVNLADRSVTLLTDHIDELRASVRRVRDMHPFHIDAMVVCRSICMRSGRCLRATLVIRLAGR